ncbi:MAG TPA: nitroreductase, partial [Petrotogaceae bacterium]|nr:nitroreductase [Petrotogaceae bacterium]
MEKPYPQESRLFDLVSPQEFKVPSLSLTELLKNRKSRRAFKNTPLSLNELSFLLWSTQGIKEIIRNGYASLRTVPSAGARHAFETYLYIRNVEGF